MLHLELASLYCDFRDLSEGDREDLTNGLESWRSRMKESEELVKSDDVKEDGLPPVRSSQGLKGVTV